MNERRPAHESVLNMKIQISWKKRPLFRPGRGEGFFRTGAEAADMLYAEALRFGPHDQIFLDTARDVLDSVAPVIDRWPQYAWVAKQLLEAERVSVAGCCLVGCSSGDQLPVEIGGFLFCFVFHGEGVCCIARLNYSKTTCLCLRSPCFSSCAGVVCPYLRKKCHCCYVRKSCASREEGSALHVIRTLLEMRSPTVRTQLRVKLCSS